ncbi:hypothetical protein BDV35DRAFT_159026 [Aspergillus flavus]|uniref:Uncharacterized protein n=1 Tax=Aspergillus flavus TaxID=5059 RepID=A0A5N6GFJ9_ASPFL|nr:hypothetical protein BDV35DRAFT_159026 [Aspergillus flavus]
MMSCIGQIRLAVRGVSEAVLDQLVVPGLAAESYSERERSAHWAQFFARDAGGAHCEGVRFNQLVAFLLQEWGENRRLGVLGFGVEVLADESRWMLELLRAVESVSSVLSSMSVVKWSYCNSIVVNWISLVGELGSRMSRSVAKAVRQIYI